MQLKILPCNSAKDCKLQELGKTYSPYDYGWGKFFLGVSVLNAGARIQEPGASRGCGSECECGDG